MNWQILVGFDGLSHTTLSASQPEPLLGPASYNGPLLSHLSLLHYPWQSRRPLSSPPSPPMVITHKTHHTHMPGSGTGRHSSIAPAPNSDKREHTILSHSLSAFNSRDTPSTLAACNYCSGWPCAWDSRQSLMGSLFPHTSIYMKNTLPSPPCLLPSPGQDWTCLVGLPIFPAITTVLWSGQGKSRAGCDMVWQKQTEQQKNSKKNQTYGRKAGNRAALTTCTHSLETDHCALLGTRSLQRINCAFLRVAARLYCALLGAARTSRLSGLCAALYAPAPALARTHKQRALFAARGTAS